jgi:hypothetical protein
LKIHSEEREREEGGKVRGEGEVGIFGHSLLFSLAASDD